MRFSKTATLLIACIIALVTFSSLRSASAQNFSYFPKTYKVQVEYWFFDTDYYYWSTVLETTDLEEAEFVYALLLHAKENNQLNEVAQNSYWRYIAVDVRMITVYQYPRYVQPSYSNFTPLKNLNLQLK